MDTNIEKSEESQSLAYGKKIADHLASGWIISHMDPEWIQLRKKETSAMAVVLLVIACLAYFVAVADFVLYFGKTSLSTSALGTFSCVLGILFSAVKTESTVYLRKQDF